MGARPESPVASPAPGWAKHFPRDEKVFMWLIAASVAAMTTFSALWVLLADHNVPTAYRRTTPQAFATQVNAFVAKYKGTDGRVYVPPGVDAYLMAARYQWYPELVFQKGTKYKIWISSVDVLHGFSLVGGTQDLNLEIAPKHVTGVNLTPSSTGRYLIVCNEYCGLSHHLMQGWLDVERPAVFQAHLAKVAGAGAVSKPGTKPVAGAAGALQLAANKSGALKFDQASLEAKAGKVTITMRNPSPLPHNVAIKTASGRSVATGPVVSTGGTSTVTATLEAGAYVFYCTVPGHEAAGMKGTLTVKR